MRISLLSLLLLLACLSMAQAQLFVYHVKGVAWVQEKNQQHPLVAEMALNTSQKLVLEPGSRVVLINQQGQNLQLQQAGTYPFAALARRFEEPQPDAGSAFLAYAWKKMNKAKLKPQQQRNAPIAGVARGEALYYHAPADSLVFSESDLRFDWLGVEGPYYFTLTDAQGKPLLRLKTPASTLSLSLAQSQFAPNTVYQWYVSEQANPAGSEQRYTFLWVDAARYRQAEQELQQLYLLVPPAALDAEGRSLLNQYLFGKLLQQ